MSRSIKKGPYVQEVLLKRVQAMNEAGEKKVLLFNLSGHGMIDMAAYDRFLAGDLVDFAPTDDQLHKSLDEVSALQ